jgi:predicted peroxiredoxin
MQNMIQSTYMRELIVKVHSVLKKKLTSLYVIGSASFEDYIENKSDLDVFGITSTSLTNYEKGKLGQILDHANFPCPAKGLDIVFMTRQNIEEIKSEPVYEFWFSTGAEWPQESWESGISTEMIVFIELCKQNGIKIYGKESSIKFGEIDKRLILKAFKEILIWHKNYILNQYHDPNGQNSVLNACRILKYIETNRFYSKTDGGEQFLKDEPNNLTVQKALRIRQKESSQKITREEIMELIKEVERKLDGALK